MVISGTAARKLTEREPGNGGRWFVASEPVENNGEDGERDADRRGVARIVVVADRQREVIERGQRVAVFGFEEGQNVRQGSRGGAVAAVPSDHQTPAQGVKRRDGIGVAESRTVGTAPTEHKRVVGCLRSLDQAVRGIHRFPIGTGRRKCENQL